MYGRRQLADVPRKQAGKLRFVIPDALEELTASLS